MNQPTDPDATAPAPTWGAARGAAVDRHTWSGLLRRLRAAPAAVGQALLLVATGRDRPLRWPRRWLRWLVIALVVVATFVTYLLAAITTSEAHVGSPAWLEVAVAVGQTLPVALLLRYPLLGWRIGWLVALLAPLLPASHWDWGSWSWVPPQIPVLLLAFVVAAWRYGRAVLWGMVALMVPVLWIWTPDSGDATGGSVALIVLAILVDSLGGRARARRALTAETERTELEKARRAVLEERARIARELHDVVAHHMSLIAVQAETAPYRLTAMGDEAGGEFGSISAQAREALREMRRLLGVLRSEPGLPTGGPSGGPGGGPGGTGLGAPLDLAPQPGLADVAGLVDGVRRAGVTVHLSLLDVPGVAPGVGLCAYRIVQEALSNATRHAPGAEVTVAIRQDGDQLDLSVGNGPPRSAGRGHGSGQGLVGMRERVDLLAGSLTTGTTPDGGFRVHARLPLTPTP
jgi:signal transduction histidine kinase